MAISHLHGEQSERRQQYPSQQAESAKERAQAACARVPSADAFDCVYEAVEASHEQATSDQDLQAQQAMANWALGMLAVSFVTALISGVGLIALLATIKQGQKGLRRARTANKIARSSASAELRPWVTIQPTVTRVDISTFLFEISLEATFKNIGRTVATNVNMNVTTVMSGDMEKTIDKHFRNWRERLQLKESSLVPGESMPTSLHHWKNIDTIRWRKSARGPGSIIFVIVIAVAYRSPFDDEWHITERTFTVGKKADKPSKERYIYEDAILNDAADVVIKPYRSGVST